MKRILSIDGGGIKGMFPATFLAELEASVERPLWEYFDLITGTSTGGIIAIGLAMGVPASTIRDLYGEKGPEIFGQERTGWKGTWDRGVAQARWLSWGPKHQSESLHSQLHSILGKLKIGHAKTRLMIPAFHGKTRQVYIFKTPHHERFQTDFNVLASDAAMATAAAPTYFREFMTTQDVGLVDGGLWANNPTGVAVAEGIGTLKWKPDEIKVLSVGCLEDVEEMPKATGAIRFARKMSGFFMAGQSYGSLGIAHILTGHVGGSDHKAIYRVNQMVPAGNYGLDNTARIADLKDRAMVEARNQKPDLQKAFFTEPAERFEPIYEVAA